MQITRNEYLIRSLNSSAVFKKEYLICLFTTYRKVKDLQFGNYDYRLLRDADGKYAFWLDGAAHLITDVASQDEPLFTPQDALSLRSGDLPNLSTAIETTVGTALLNAAILCIPFGNKVAYINSSKTLPSDIEKIIQDRFADDITHNPDKMKELLETNAPHIHVALPGESPDKIYVREYLVCSKMMGQLTCLESFIVPGLTKKALTYHPDRDKVLKEVMEQFKGKPIGAAEAAIIEKRMIELDAEHLKDDPSRHLFTERKALVNARKRLYYTYGYVEPFTSEQQGTFSERSLSDGIDFNKLPELINSSYSGSISRGLETQFTGANKKDSDRIFQNASVAMDDCGTKLGVMTKITSSVFPTLIGMYYIDQRGATVVIAPGDFSVLDGKTLLVRSPIYCNSPRLTKCTKCAGDRISMNPKGINIAASDIDSAFMVAKLKKMHTSSSNSTQYNYTSTIE